MSEVNVDARYKTYSIELDCAPGSIRPNDLIAGVLKDSGLNVDDFTTGKPFFGHQIWILKDNGKDEIFTNAKVLFKERIEVLYYDGVIRYGTW